MQVTEGWLCVQSKRPPPMVDTDSRSNASTPSTNPGPCGSQDQRQNSAQWGSVSSAHGCLTLILPSSHIGFSLLTCLLAPSPFVPAPVVAVGANIASTSGGRDWTVLPCPPFCPGPQASGYDEVEMPLDHFGV